MHKKCTFDPEKITGPIGMFHCPECGEMVVAGMSHPDYGLLDLQGECEGCGIPLKAEQKFCDRCKSWMV